MPAQTREFDMTFNKLAAGAGSLLKAMTLGLSPAAADNGLAQESGTRSCSEAFYYGVAKGRGTGNRYILAPGASSSVYQGTSSTWRTVSHTVRRTGSWEVEAYGSLDAVNTYAFCTS